MGSRSLPLLCLVAVAITTGWIGESHAAPPVEVNSCGQFATKGFLGGDLDCTGFPGDAVTIERSLDLNGFTLTGGLLSAVTCLKSCKINGPGTITGSGAFGVNIHGVGKVTEVNLTDNGLAGVQCFEKCKVRGPATISGNGNNGVRASSATIRDVVLSGNSGPAVEAQNNKQRGRAKLRDSIVTGNGSGVLADRKVVLRDTTVSGNGQFGILSGDSPICEKRGVAVLRDSNVTGNGIDVECGVTIACADVATCMGTPKLKGTATCDTSYMVGSGVPGDDWDTCALD